MDEAPLIPVFEMLIERLSKLEAASESLLEERRYVAEHGPPGTLVAPSLLGRGNIGVMKHYNGELEVNDVILIRCDSRTSVFMNHDWASGVKRHWSDDLVEAAIGVDAASDIRRKAAAAVEKHGGKWGSITCDEVGLPERAEELLYGWLNTALRHKFPEEFMAFRRNIVLTVHESATYSLLQRVVNLATEVLTLVISPHSLFGISCLHVYRVREEGMAYLVTHVTEAKSRPFDDVESYKMTIDDEICDIKKGLDTPLSDHRVFTVDALQSIKRERCRYVESDDDDNESDDDDDESDDSDESGDPDDNPPPGVPDDMDGSWLDWDDPDWWSHAYGSD